MASRLGERIIALLDWCWPFPLGIAAGTLALVMAAGAWLLFREQRQIPAGQASVRAGSPDTPARVPAGLPSPSQSAAQELANSPEAQTPTPRPIATSEESNADTRTRLQPGRAATSPDRLASPSSSKAISPPAKVSSTAKPAEPQVPQPKAQPSSTAPQLSAAQMVEITDRLKIGRFLMDREDYQAAIKEFQAVLAIDPSNRMAKAAIDQAQKAAKNPESDLQP